LNSPTSFLKPSLLRSRALWFFLIILVVSWAVGQQVKPVWTTDKITLDVQKVGPRLAFTYQGKQKYLPEPLTLYSASPLHPERLKALQAKQGQPEIEEDFVIEKQVSEGQEKTLYYWLKGKKHWSFWSLLPALTAIGLCWLTREPLTALLGGIIAGAALLGKFDLTEEIFVPSLASESSAQILILYLWLLGGLMGIWSRMGAPQAFAEMMSKYVVRGPRSARLVAWLLGVIFFQGGTVSTVLVGTTVKPLADKEKISHEELSFIVDSTASPIACLLPFNAWPGYVQSFIFVAGIPFLATETDRLAFFFKSIPLSFYAILAVLSTFLLSIDKLPFMNKQLKEAVARARSSGQLDAPNSRPLSAPELHVSSVPKGYTPHVIDFFLPLAVLIGLAIGTFVLMGSPKIRWAFGAALLVAAALAAIRGMDLIEIVEGFGEGLKGVVVGSVILLLAVTIGGIAKATGGGNYLVELLGSSLPFWSLPVLLEVLTIIIAFSTGTSWGTYAVAFPLAMPLAWAVAQSQGLHNSELYLMLCFAAVMNGSVFGDQCSPISDTTVLSSMCTGGDLMDHVNTQFPQAVQSAVLAGVGWTLMTLLCR
jgi:Na+/H+ antiporter NhaC